MAVSDDTILGEGFQNFFKKLGTKGLHISKKMAKIVLKNPSGALDITANFATAAVSRNPKNVISSLPEVIQIYHTGKGLYLGKIVRFYAI